MVNGRGRCSGRLGLGWYPVLVLASCGGVKPDNGRPTTAPLAAAPGMPESATAKAVLSTMRSRSGMALPTGLADGFDPVGGGLRARFGSGRESARVQFPDVSLAAVQLEDVGSGAAVDNRNLSAGPTVA